jgi:hypothetical protein
MSLYSLDVPKDDAQRILNKLGDIGQSHFIDLNSDASPLTLPYTTDIKLIEDTERKLQALLDMCKKYYVDVNAPTTTEKFTD